MGKIIPTAQEKGLNILITSDHGNAEKMLDEKGRVFTAHSKNPVPFVVYYANGDKIDLNDGILADIAPTILQIMGIPQPLKMTGRSLIRQI